MKKYFFPNVLKAFARDGKQIYLGELRAAIFPLSITLTTGFLSGLAIPLVPGFVYLMFKFFATWSKGQSLASINITTMTADYLYSVWPYLTLFSLAGIFVAWLRRFFITHNLALVKQIDGDIELRIGIEELAAVVVFTSGLLLISEGARFFYIFTVFGAFLLTYTWEYFQNILLTYYALFTGNKAPETLFSVWSILLQNNAVVDRIGIKENGHTAIVEGKMTDLVAVELQKQIKRRVVGIKRVDIQQISTGQTGKMKKYSSRHTA